MKINIAQKLDICKLNTVIDEISTISDSGYLYLIMNNETLNSLNNEIDNVYLNIKISLKYRRMKIAVCDILEFGEIDIVKSLKE